MPDVTSSVILRLDYDPVASRLTITFRSGRVYRYDGVSLDVYEAFLAAESKGAFFNARVRDRYPEARIEVKASSKHSV